MIATARQVKYGGHEFTVEPEPADFWGWVEEGRYDTEWRALQAHLRPEHTFLDLGAWVGSHSLLASKICKRVIAVEPDPEAYNIAVGNMAQNGHYFLVVPAAISDKSGTIELGSGCLGASTTRANPAEGGGIGRSEVFTTAISMTLPQLLEKTHAEAPLFVKADVEGSEEQIIGDLVTLRPDSIYMELHPWWWADEPAMWRQISDLAALYKTVLNRHGDAVNLPTRPREIIFIGEQA
jgi:FkbM family methyltransferase